MVVVICSGGDASPRSMLNVDDAAGSSGVNENGGSMPNSRQASSLLFANSTGDGSVFPAAAHAFGMSPQSQQSESMVKPALPWSSFWF